MPLAKRWQPRPIGLWIRKSSFRLHFWLGAMATAYILFVSATGCAIMFEHELYRFFAPDPRVISPGAPRLGVDELQRAAQREYPNGRVVGVWDKLLSTGRVAEIWLEEDGLLRRRLFDPYAGTDLGDAQPVSLRVLASLRNAHVNLLAGRAGRAVNGIGSVALMMMSLSGGLMWWAGVKNRRARQRPPGSRRQTSYLRTWDYHRIAGVWTLVFAMMWGTTGACFAFPSLLHGVSGESVLRWLYMVHTGSAGGWPTRMIWTVSGFATSFLAVTGMMMWWKRVSAGRRADPALL
jgi:uncharacterized iron-regulated membrane protein